MIRAFLIYSLCFALLTSCGFNKLFLVPTKLNQETKQITLKGKNDSTVVYFSGETHQPVFLKNGTDTIHSDFTIQSYVFESSSGNKLNGWLLKPKNGKSEITLVHFHGNAGNLIRQYKTISPLVKHGYQIFLFDYSGFGFSTGKATRKNVLKDAHSALTFAKTLPEIKNTKLVVYGHSLGGHLSAVVAAERQNDMDALVIEGAFSSHQDIAAKTAGFLGRILVRENYCAYKSLRNYHKPLLVIHSTEDETIPYEMGEKIFNNANAPKSFYRIEKCHICGPRYYTDSIASKIQSLLRFQ